MTDENIREDWRRSESILERNWDDDTTVNRYRMEIRDVLVVGSIRLGELFIKMEGNEPRGMSLVQEPGIFV